MKGCHLIEDAPKGPYVWLLLVLFSLQELGAHIERWSKHGGSKDWLWVLVLIFALLGELLGKPEIAEFRVAFFIKENIRWLQITVEDHFLVFPTVALKKGQDKLHQNWLDIVFFNESSLLLALIY